MIGMLAVLLILGFFIDQTSIMMITLPFYMPLLRNMGVDQVWFGILYLLCMQIGLLTPPFGLLLFVLKGVAPPGITIDMIYRAAIPYVWLTMLMMALIFLIPCDRHRVRAGLSGYRMADAGAASESWIGRSTPRREAARLTAGRGRYTDDIAVAGAGHVAFLRSPYAHARIDAIDVAAAKARLPALSPLSRPATSRPCAGRGRRSCADQEPRVAAAASDGAWRGLLARRSSRRCRRANPGAGRGCGGADPGRMERRFPPSRASTRRPRRAPRPPTPRRLAISASIIHLRPVTPTPRFETPPQWLSPCLHVRPADRRHLGAARDCAEFDPRTRQLTVRHSHQAPHMMREIFAAQLGLPLSHVRVIAPDVGGAFGMKLAAYPDEMAVAAIAVLLGRPVRFAPTGWNPLSATIRRARPGSMAALRSMPGAS